MPVEGGFILIARRMLESELMDSPAHYVKLWIWMLLKANWKDREKLKRGQFVTSIAEMQKAGGHKVGYRFKALSKGEVRSSYEAFAKANMISTAKTTRGMIITILNYDTYQDLTSYEQHTEQHDEEHANNTGTAHDTERKRNTRNKESKRSCPIPSDEFNQFYSAYPKREGKMAALKAWSKFNGQMKDLFPVIMAAIKAQKASVGSALCPDNGPKYIPLPASWLNGRRWEDEIPHTPTVGRTGLEDWMNLPDEKDVPL